MVGGAGVPYLPLLCPVDHRAAADFSGVGAKR